MELGEGKVAVVTGGASGIGLALGERFAAEGMSIVLADVQDDALAVAVERVEAQGVDVLPVRVDVSKEADVAALAAATIERFGRVHVVCNNAGVGTRSDPWFGPINAWEWVIGVNFWGVVHGCRTFLPHLLDGGHIVNTASIAGLIPATTPSYDASKHAVVALTESLYHTVTMAGLPIGVSVLCPGWVRTNILGSDRNWPAHLGEPPQPDPVSAVTEPHLRRALAEGATPASIADAVAVAVVAGRFWIIPQQEFLDLVVQRWHSIAERLDPAPAEHVPGMPPRSQIIDEVMTALGMR